MPTRLLAIGDVHLGRSLRRIPDLLDPDNLGPAAALRAAVATARAMQVDAVLLAGDVADQDQDLFRAHGVLTEVLGLLGRDGIPVYAVAGNHDHRTLPRLRAALPTLQILGEGGTWETVTVDGAGGPVDILGWSFPDRHHQASPADGLVRIDHHRPTVGLLHADLDAPGSNYAPVHAHELRAAGPVRWLLGHIHQPSLDPDDDCPGYLGSLVGLHPNETGPRGPWLVSVDGQQIQLQHLQQAPLRWEQLDVAVENIAEPTGELHGVVAEALRDFASAHEAELAGTEAVGVRVRLVGRAAWFRGLADAADALSREDFPVTMGDRVLFVDRLENATRPCHPLDDLAARDDPPGLLARELKALEAGQASALLERARLALARVDRQSQFVALRDDQVAEDRLTARLLEAGYAVLDDLLAQQGGDHGPA